MALTWDFAREIASGSPGNTTSYYDEWTQAFYTNGGYIVSQIGLLEAGQWQDVNYESEQQISESGYSELDIEHHFNGVVAGSAQHSADVVFLMYVYMLDVSKWVQSGSFQKQADNPIKAGQVILKNTDSALFEYTTFSMFAPGNRLTFQFRAGDSSPYVIGEMYIETSPFADYSNSFTFQGRNLLGFLLATQTLDEAIAYTGTFTAIFIALLTAAGVPAQKMMVQTTESTAEFTFKPSDTFLSAMEQATAICDWYFDDKPDGTIVVGDASYIRTNVASTAIYEFDRATELVSRSVDRNISGVYSRVCINRGGATPRKVYAAVPYFNGWYVGANRTYRQDVADDISDAQMDALCTQMVDKLQYSGVIEKFDSPFRPWLQVGDIARVTGGLSPRLAGIITELIDTFGEQGFFTQMSVTSGGLISNPENPETVASKYVGKLGGMNRQRRLLDYIQNGTKTVVDDEPVGAVTYQAAVSGGYTGNEQTLNANLAKVADGAIVPDGGTQNQVLRKATATDYDTEWADLPESIWGGM